MRPQESVVEYRVVEATRHISGRRPGTKDCRGWGARAVQEVGAHRPGGKGLRRRVRGHRGVIIERRSAR
jgi:hypothetical protein